MRGDMGDMASPQGRGRQRDRTDVFADESQALDEIAKQVRDWRNCYPFQRSMPCSVRCVTLENILPCKICEANIDLTGKLLA